MLAIISRGGHLSLLSGQQQQQRLPWGMEGVVVVVVVGSVWCAAAVSL